MNFLKLIPAISPKRSSLQNQKTIVAFGQWSFETTLIHLLLLLLPITISCTGQNNTPQNIVEIKSAGPQPFVLLTEKSNYEKKECSSWYDNLHCMLQDKKVNCSSVTDEKKGCDGKGVYRFDGKALATFTTRDGLANNNISCTEDKTGNTCLAPGE